MALPFFPAPRRPFSALPDSLSGRLAMRFRGHPADELPALPAPVPEVKAKAKAMSGDGIEVGAKVGTKLGFSGRFQAGIAEFLLITRLRARQPVNKSAQSAEVIACGAKIVQLTCKHWFGSTTPAERRAQTSYRTRL